MTSATRASISSWVQLGDEVGGGDTNGVVKMVGGDWLTSTEDSGDGATLLSSVDQSESQAMGDVATSRTEGFAGDATRPQRQTNDGVGVTWRSMRAGMERGWEDGVGLRETVLRQSSLVEVVNARSK